MHTVDEVAWAQRRDRLLAREADDDGRLVRARFALPYERRNAGDGAARRGRSS